MSRIVNKQILVIILLCFVSRLPQILSNNLFLDGDECIVGLMAKHLFEGIEFPLYFYGQFYGFSLLEVGLISSSYSLFGISDIGIKLAMLLLWTIGILFFYKTLSQLNGKYSWAPLLITVIFIFCPAWAVWSMKARGGYLTSFLLSSLFCYLLLNERFNRRQLTYLFLGLLLIIIYESQPLWIPGLVPIIGYSLIRLKKIRLALFLITGVVLGYTFFHFFIHGDSSPGALGMLGFSDSIFESIGKIPRRIFQNMTGSYHYWRWIDLNWVTNLLAMCYTISILAVLGTGLYYIIRKKMFTPLFYVFALSVLFTLACSVFSDRYNSRHLLPLMGYSLLMFFMFMDRFKSKALYISICAFFISLGVFSLFSFKDYKMEKQDKVQLLALINYLEKKEVQYVFCTHGLMQWQVMFYSQERVIARCVNMRDRYPAYIERVNKALNDSDANIALVGPYGKQPPENPEGVVFIEEQYFIYLNPDRDLLIDQGFSL